MHAAIPDLVPEQAIAGASSGASVVARAALEHPPGAATARRSRWVRLPCVDPDALFATVQRVVVVAPRPGDGIRAVGGLLAAAARRDLPVWALVLTDGGVEAGAAMACDAAATPWRIRLDAALDELGVRSGGIERFRLPVGSLDQQRDTLGDRFRRLVQPGDLVLAPSAAHGDAEDAAVARAAAVATLCTGCVQLGFLPGDGWPAGHGEGRLQRFALDRSLAERKEAAWRAFAGSCDSALAEGLPQRQPAGFELLAVD